jgi:hypothetical protein
VKSLSFQCFDASQYDTGLPWMESWDSRQRVSLAAQYEEAQEAGETGITRVTGGTGGAGSQTALAAAAGETELDLQAALPPAAIPSAVRVEVVIYAGDEHGTYKDKDGNLMAPRTYSAVIPLLAAQRIPLQIEEGMLDDGTGTGTGAGGGADGTGGSTQVWGSTAGPPKNSAIEGPARTSGGARSGGGGGRGGAVPMPGGARSGGGARGGR